MTAEPRRDRRTIAPDDADRGGYPRKRRQTRRRLLNAGTAVLADRGPGNVSAAEIANAAGVAIGTFYNHFPSVEDFIDAVANDLGRGIEIGSDTLADIEHDPARRVAIGVLQLLRMADDDPASAAAFAALVAVRPEFRARVRGIVGQAIRDGVDAGRFDVAPGESATNAVLGTTLQAMRSRLLGETDPSDALDVARLVLRVLGTDEHETDAIIEHSLAAAPRVERADGRGRR